jgi:aldehyde dehydrogenase (NAD+)
VTTLSPPHPVEAQAVVTELRRYHGTGATRNQQWRLEQLAGLRRFLTEQEPAIRDALAADLGRPAHFAWLGDIAPLTKEIDYAARNLTAWIRPRRTGLPITIRPGRAEYRYEPLGVVLIIGPWNYPLYLTLGPLIGALAAGNCAVLKPSEHAPAVSTLLAQRLGRYLDPKALAVIEGDASATQAILDSAVDHAFFTGGPEIGKKVMAAASAHLTPVTLELGGKSPVLVTAKADLDVAARRITWTKLLNAGQTCVAPDYVLVDRAVEQAFTERLAAAYETMLAADPAQRVINDRQFTRLTRILETSNGRILRGGGRQPDTLGFEPTIVVEPDLDSELMTEEIFGPILPVLSYSGLDEAIARINAGPKPLAAYVFTNDTSDAERIVNEVPAGGTVVNHLAFHCMIPQLPFGGVGNSGMGDYHGEFGFQTFSNRKAVLRKPAKPDPQLMYPPYGQRKMRLLRRFL